MVVVKGILTKNNLNIWIVKIKYLTLINLYIYGGAVEELFLYDPGVPEHNKLPTKKHDMVICTDVLEHIPEEDLDWILREMCSLSNSTVFINVSCQPALKTFTTGKYKGENVHVSLFDHEWWVDKVKHVWKDYQDLKIYLTSTTKEGIMGTCIKKD